MILHQNATFTAKLHHEALVVTDRSPDLPPPPSRIPMIHYLTMMALFTPERWKAASMAFDGMTFTVTMERFKPESEQPPKYLIQMLSLAPPAQEIGWSYVDEQKSLVSRFRSFAQADGWTELATSKPMAELGGGLTIATIWMK